jgi:hypothetical protein
MVDSVRLGRPTFFKHRADKIDAPTWRFILVAREHIGRAGVRAKAVMHAGLQDGVGFGDLRIAQLGGGEIGLHDKPNVDRQS